MKVFVMLMVSVVAIAADEELTKALERRRRIEEQRLAFNAAQERLAVVGQDLKTWEGVFHEHKNALEKAVDRTKSWEKVDEGEADVVAQRLFACAVASKKRRALEMERTSLLKVDCPVICPPHSRPFADSHAIERVKRLEREAPKLVMNEKQSSGEIYQSLVKAVKSARIQFPGADSGAVSAIGLKNTSFFESLLKKKDVAPTAFCNLFSEKEKEWDLSDVCAESGDGNLLAWFRGQAPYSVCQKVLDQIQALKGPELLCVDSAQKDLLEQYVEELRGLYESSAWCLDDSVYSVLSSVRTMVQRSDAYLSSGVKEHAKALSTLFWHLALSHSSATVRRAYGSNQMLIVLDWARVILGKIQEKKLLWDEEK